MNDSTSSILLFISHFRLTIASGLCQRGYSARHCEQPAIAQAGGNDVGKLTKIREKLYSLLTVS